MQKDLVWNNEKLYNRVGFSEQKCQKYKSCKWADPSASITFELKLYHTIATRYTK